MISWSFPKILNLTFLKDLFRTRFLTFGKWFWRTTFSSSSCSQSCQNAKNPEVLKNFKQSLKLIRFWSFQSFIYNFSDTFYFTVLSNYLCCLFLDFFNDSCSESQDNKHRRPTNNFLSWRLFLHYYFYFFLNKYQVVK